MTNHLLAGPEIRTASNGGFTFRGYASVTGREYDCGSFMEIIAPGAFKRSLSEKPDTVFTINHGMDGSLPLARTTSGTLRLSEDQVGLLAEADLDPEDPAVVALKRKIDRKDVTDMSFMFFATDDDWDDRRGHRVVRSLSLHRGDVSAVTAGANPYTSLSMRSLGGDEYDMPLEVRERRIRELGRRVTGRTSMLLADAPSAGRPGPVVARTRFVLPDHTSPAKARLAALRGNQRRVA
jgi:HK97 family phage prohead protease